MSNYTHGQYQLSISCPFVICQKSQKCIHIVAISEHAQKSFGFLTSKGNNYAHLFVAFTIVKEVKDSFPLKIETFK